MQNNISSSTYNKVWFVIKERTEWALVLEKNYTYRPLIITVKKMAKQNKTPRLPLSLRYKIEVNQQSEARSLPLRLLIAGYFSQVYSTELDLDLDERHISH